ncbi:uncharacterized protein EV422DRAFT_543786 [Fimicolochytrium jonesii]|uniref:uncharacterized protein n=1 Tax=Fimicolochytrium jonesii TaxID=1396493 RepID=UPI0022FEEB74|nr:uncharacterized protein EV422DRAFT_543786 [Fimicolochytrium jonesii]KAI8816978.1 hypothetical protein EV422DRAFT_543786 [Fimicolochytrium jonesii]
MPLGAGAGREGDGEALEEAHAGGWGNIANVGNAEGTGSDNGKDWRPLADTATTEEDSATTRIESFRGGGSRSGIGSGVQIAADDTHHSRNVEDIEREDGITGSIARVRHPKSRTGRITPSSHSDTDQAIVPIPSSPSHTPVTPLAPPSVLLPATHKSSLFHLLRRLELFLRIRPPTLHPYPRLTHPWLPRISKPLSTLLDRLPSTVRFIPRFLYPFLWLLTFALLVSDNNYKATTSEGAPQYVSCTDQLWAWASQQCGLDGMYCSPFANASFVIRCPAECASTRNQNRRWLGGTMQGWLVPWVVGGGPPPSSGTASAPYRAESWLCPSAIHAGLISNHWGGCAAIDLIGATTAFPSTTSNGITSLGFDSWFPKSYTVRALAHTAHCTDRSWAYLPILLVFALLFTTFTRPSRALFTFTFVSFGFWYTIFLGAVPIHGDGWTSAAFGTYLVLLAFTHVLHTHVIRHTLPTPLHSFPLETAILVIAPFTFILHLELITAPLTNFGLTSRAFADPQTLIIFIIALPLVLAICAIQLFHLRKHGLLGSYLLAYAAAVAVYLLLPKLLGLYIHLHHYILGLLLAPLTRIQTRASMILQWACVGLLVQGVARWGPASPLATAFENTGGDEVVSVPRPELVIDQARLANNATIAWRYADDGGTATTAYDPGNYTIPAGLPYDAFSLLLNDVEVYRGPRATYRVEMMGAVGGRRMPWYVRVALVSGGSPMEYSWPVWVSADGAVGWPNGTVLPPLGT